MLSTLQLVWICTGPVLLGGKCSGSSHLSTFLGGVCSTFGEDSIRDGTLRASLCVGSNEESGTLSQTNQPCQKTSNNVSTFDSCCFSQCLRKRPWKVSTLASKLEPPFLDFEDTFKLSFCQDGLQAAGASRWAVRFGGFLALFSLFGRWL